MNDAVFVPDLAQAAQAEIARLDAAARLHHVDGRHGKIAWREFGSGAPLVLLHGGHGSWLHWVRNIEALSQDHTLLIPDMPGYGDSGDPPSRAGEQELLMQIVDALIASLDQLLGAGVSLDLAGFSFGGLVAALLARQRGGVRRMSLLGSAGHGTARRPGAGLAPWQGLPQADMLAALRHNLGAHMLHADASIDALALAVHEHSCLRTRFKSRLLSRTRQLPEALAAFSQPVLLIWGEHDVTANPMTLAHQLAELCAAGDWCVVPGAGHWVQYECAQTINPMLASWFGPGQRRYPV
ncbi:alpha/beta fold hydrolase [Achromobacter aegrifaciens]